MEALTSSRKLGHLHSSVTRESFITRRKELRLRELKSPSIHDLRTLVGVEDLVWDYFLLHIRLLKSVKTTRQKGEADVTAQESPAVCSAFPSKDFSTKKFGPTMWVDGAWNYYHHQFWMKERKHIFNKGGGSFQFSCVVRTTRTMPQMISSTSKEFTFRSGNVPLLCQYTGFSPPKRGIVCLVSLFIFSSVPITIVLNSLSRRLITMPGLVINMTSF